MTAQSTPQKDGLRSPVHGFWSTQTLRKRLDRDKIVVPYDRSRTREANYRLAMGDEYFVTKSATDTNVARESTMKLEPGDSFCVPSGHFGFLVTEENVCLPPNAIGFLSIQTSVKFLGLVNISGFHVDPGSNGKIIFAVFNAGPDPVHIKRGDEIFRLWIASLDEVDEEPRSQISHTGIPSEIVNQISGDLESLQTLLRRVKTVESTLTTHRAFFRVCVLLLVALLVGVIVQGFLYWRPMHFESTEETEAVSGCGLSSCKEVEARNMPVEFANPGQFVVRESGHTTQDDSRILDAVPALENFARENRGWAASVPAVRILPIRSGFSG